MNERLQELEAEARKTYQRARQDAQIALGGEHGERLVRHLEDKFEVHLGAWRDVELAEFAPEACDTMAKLRDGRREVVEYLMQLLR